MISCWIILHHINITLACIIKTFFQIFNKVIQACHIIFTAFTASNMYSSHRKIIKTAYILIKNTVTAGAPFETSFYHANPYLLT